MNAIFRAVAGPIENDVAAIIDRRRMIKEMVMSLEQEFGARKTMGKLDSIIRNFAVFGGNRPHINCTTPEGEVIWRLLQSMARVTSHAEALAVVRDVQKEYCDFVEAAGVN